MRVIVDTNAAENDVGAVRGGAGLRQSIERGARSDHIFAFHGSEFCRVGIESGRGLERWGGRTKFLFITPHNITVPGHARSGRRARLVDMNWGAPIGSKDNLVDHCRQYDRALALNLLVASH